MLCPRCYGKRVVPSGAGWMPCPECAGVGSLHCCDGLQEREGCEAPTPPKPAVLSVPPAAPSRFPPARA